MKVQELRRHLEQKGLGPLYLVVGEEPYFVDQALSIFRQAISTGTEKTSQGTNSGSSVPLFNCDILYGDETDASEILSVAEEVSFFSSRRTIIVKWAEKLSSRDGEALIPYLQSPNDSTTLIFSAAKLDGRMKWVQELKKRSIPVDCAPLYDNQRSAWVAQQARKCEVKLDSVALELLKEQAAEGLYSARTELEKLSVFLSEGQTAGANAVETLRGKSPGISVFDWSEAVARGDHGRALDIVAKNLETGEAPLRMVGAILWQLRRIWKVKTTLGPGKDAGQVARQAGIPPFRAAEFIQQAQRWSESHLRKAWELLAKTDSALKGGRATSPKIILDDLVIQLCRSGRSQEGAMANTTTPLSQKRQGRR